VHLIVGAYDPSVGHGHFKIIVAVVGLKLNIVDGDAAVPVTLIFYVVCVILRHSGIVQGDCQGILPADLVGTCFSGNTGWGIWIERLLAGGCRSRAAWGARLVSGIGTSSRLPAASGQYDQQESC